MIRSVHRWFAGWTVAALLATLAFLTLASIGLAILPVAAIGLWWWAWRAPWWPDALGLACGLGTTLALVGIAAATSGAAAPTGVAAPGAGIAVASLVAHLYLVRRSAG